MSHLGAIALAPRCGLAWRLRVSVYNLPINRAADGQRAATASHRLRRHPPRPTTFWSGLAFSGGGTRAAAFSFGVLQEIEQIPLRGAGTHSLLDRVDFVSGVSGGSVTAAYFGLKKRDALADFRERFLLRNAEEALNTSVVARQPSAARSAAASTTPPASPRWLDAICSTARPSRDFRATGRPRIWINASDIYNRTPFVFGETAFAAMCSDLATYPIVGRGRGLGRGADRVRADRGADLSGHAAPIRCRTGSTRARNNRNAPPMLSAFAKAINRYRDGSVPYVKLLDGGLVDNFGLSGFTIARQSAETPYEPLSPAAGGEAAPRHVPGRRCRPRHRPATGCKTVEGPSGVELVKAAADTAMEASVGASYTAFDAP